MISPRMATAPSSRPPDPARVLAEVPIFAGLDAATLQRIAEQVDWRHIHGGGVLFRQGEPGDALYFVVSGRLRVLLEERTGRGRGALRPLRDVTRGETAGELALVTGEPRSATVIAVRDTELGRLSRDAFTQLLEREPATSRGLTRMLAHWLTTENHQARDAIRPSTIALVPLGGAAPRAEFAERLVRALATQGKTLHLNAARLDQACGAGASAVLEHDSDYTRITAWLNDQESVYRFIIYEADDDLTPWTLRCLSQADRILRIASAASPPDLGPVTGPRGSAGLIGGGTDQELVLLHRNTTPVGTERWLVLGDFTTHHHLRLDSEPDFGRLARHLAGRAVGLVLGGGGARGFAHIGVIRALEELKIPIDRLGGASMGAVVAAQYARGMTPAEMIDLNRRGWIGYRPHRDYTLPLIALVSGRAAGRMLKMMFGDLAYEDLWLNAYCVSTNLTRAELIVHRSGSVRRWLRASISIPGTAPPVIDDSGDLLVDGGVLDNVPVAAMRDLGDSEIIAVDVSPHVDLVVDPAMKLAPTPWQILGSRFRGRTARRNFPSLFQIIYRTSLLSSVRTGKLGRGTVARYLEPPVGGFDTFDMDAIDEIVEAGYRYAMGELGADGAGRGRVGE